MTGYDLARLRLAIANLPAPAPSHTAQGRKLQDLTEWLLAGIPSCQVELRNKHDAGNAEEKDLWFSHSPAASGLPFIDILVPVECKNEGTKVSSAEVREFGAKIRNSGGCDGLLVSRNGLAGASVNSAHLAVHDELARGARIVVIVAADLMNIATTNDLVALIVARHLELRTEQTYVTI